ncbi:MAG: hypothetical protein IKB60_01275 [Clostridia bacterium]|nr:hypothetical protein [Clostridia bacterium]
MTNNEYKEYVDKKTPNSTIVKDAVEKKILYIAKCHLCHQTGKVWLIDENLEEVKLDNI